MPSNSDQFTGKVVMITGASGGIGTALVDEFMVRGATVIACCRSAEKMMSTPPHATLEYDVSDPVASQEVFRSIRASYGRLDVAVNNAGILNDVLLSMMTNEKLQIVLDTNTSAVIRHMRDQSRLMLPKRSGSIINVASIVGLDGNIGQVAYAASKAAIVGATRASAKELAPFGIRVNAVAPGLIDTQMLRSVDPNKVKILLDRTPMGRLAKSEEVAKVIAFLASDDASYVTGHTLRIDGGLSI